MFAETENVAPSASGDLYVDLYICKQWQMEEKDAICDVFALQ